MRIIAAFIVLGCVACGSATGVVETDDAGAVVAEDAAVDAWQDAAVAVTPEVVAPVPINPCSAVVSGDWCVDGKTAWACPATYRIPDACESSVLVVGNKRSIDGKGVQILCCGA